MPLNRGRVTFLGVADIALGAVPMWFDPISAIGVLTSTVRISFVMRGIASIVFSYELHELLGI